MLTEGAEGCGAVVPGVVAGGLLMYTTYAYLFIAFAFDRFFPREGGKKKTKTIKIPTSSPPTKEQLKKEASQFHQLTTAAVAENASEGQ